MPELMSSSPRLPWPPVIVGALRRRRRDLIAQVSGRVLHLGDPDLDLPCYAASTAAVEVVIVESDPRRAEAAASRAAELQVPVEVVTAVDQLDVDSVEAVVSIMALPLIGALDEFLTSMGAVLGPGGIVHFIEPVGQPGTLNRVLGLATPLLRPTAGLSLGRDVPSALRTHGFTVTSIERFTMPTLIWSLRHFVEGSARVIDGVST